MGFISSSEHKLHYDLDFLNIGGKWKPTEDKYRIDNYRFAQEQFELTPDDMIRKVIPQGLLDLRHYNDFIHYTKLLAYPRLLTLKTVDMVVGQPPLISAEAKHDETQKIRDISSYSQLISALKQALIDYSRFGICLLRVFKDERDRAQVTTWDPEEWIPVFYPDGTYRIHYNVVGWVYQHKLTVQIHNTEDGSYEERVCGIDNVGNILSIDSATVYNKDSGKRLLFAITNTPTSTNPLGTNDYEIINGLLQKAIERLTAILRVLDEHADPSMTGPSSLLSKNENGDTVFKTGKYYAVAKDEMKPEYLVWDANLDSSFKAFDELCKQMYVLSEMGEAFLGASGGTGNVVSGTAMRFKMISPLEKARRICNDITRPIQELVSSMLMLEGCNIDAKDINVTWRDSLPKDPREVAELAKLESGSVSIKPLLHAIMDNFDLDEDSAMHYVEEILKDQANFSKFKATKKESNNPEALGSDGSIADGRSHPAEGMVDARKKGSAMDPSGEVHHGTDTQEKVK